MFLDIFTTYFGQAHFFIGLLPVPIQLACLFMIVCIFLLQLERKLSDLYKPELKLLELETRTNARLSSMRAKSDKNFSDLEISMNTKLTTMKIETDMKFVRLRVSVLEKYFLGKSDEMQEHRDEMIPPLSENVEEFHEGVLGTDQMAEKE